MGQSTLKIDSHATVTIERVSRYFGSLQALDEVTLSIPAGGIFGLLGPNGAGKTTLIRILLGLLMPSAGSCRVAGGNPAVEPEMLRQHVGAMLENRGLYARLSAEENLEFHGRIWNMPVSRRRERIRSLLKQAGLWERRAEPLRHLSRGMNARVAFLRAIMHRPRLLILDEPTSGLDPVAAVSLREEITRLAREETVTIILSTHNLAEAEGLCSAIAILNRGRVLATGSPESLITAGRDKVVRIDGAGWTDELLATLQHHSMVLSVRRVSDVRLELRMGEDTGLDGILRVISASGGRIDHIEESRSSLEEVFLSLVGRETPCQPD